VSIALNDLPRRKLIELVATYGRDVCNEPARCKGFLLDVCSEYKREVNILVTALDERVAAELLASSVNTPYPVLQVRLTRRMYENRGLTEDFARWGVDSWALALGLIAESQLLGQQAGSTQPARITPPANWQNTIPPRQQSLAQPPPPKPPPSPSPNPPPGGAYRPYYYAPPNPPPQMRLARAPQKSGTKNIRRSRTRVLLTWGVLVLLILAGVVWVAISHSQLPHPPATTTGRANATATANALATAINRASTPQDIYMLLTSSSPVLTDPLSGQDANGWEEKATTDGGCKFTGGAYHSYVLRPYVAECYAQAKSFPQASVFALQVQVTLVKGDGGSGLIFGYRGGNLRYYRFVVRSDGYFDLYDPWTQRQLPYGTNSAFKSNPGQPNLLTVIVRTSVIYLYINSTYVGQASMEADTSVSGEIGLFSVDGQQNPTEVEFHDMKVWVIR
jgi:hypothetical protein